MEKAIKIKGTRVLVVYHSRTGQTKKVAETISNLLGGDIEEIVDTKDRTGLLGYIHSGRQAMKKKLTAIKNTEKEPSKNGSSISASLYWKVATNNFSQSF